MNHRTSVIIPVRNGARFIADAIASVLPQLALTDEVIVVDDASTDHTLTVLSDIGDGRVRVLRGLGRGVSSSRNIGLGAATGDFIAFLDHDDLWPASRHAALLEVLLADDTIDCAVGRLRLRMEPDAVWIPQLAGMDGRLAANLSLCTALFRRRTIDLAGHFDEQMKFCEDTDYFLRLMEKNYRVVLHDVDALIYRRHGTNATCDVVASEAGVMELIKRRRVRMSRRQDQKD